MTPGKLVLLRLYGLSLGRVPAAAQLLRKAIVKKVVLDQRRDPYVASSRFFDPAELGPPAEEA